jgi:hypothetical protein
MLALVSDAPPGDVRLGLPFFVGGPDSIAALGLAVWHFQRQRALAGWHFSSLIFHDTRTHPHSRFRFTSHPAHCPPGARSPCVLRSTSPAMSAKRGFANYAKDGSSKGIILSGSHASIYEETTDKAPQVVFELGVPVLGYLLRHAGHGPTIGRQGRGRAHPRVWFRTDSGTRPHQACSKAFRTAPRRGPRHAGCLDEPWRQGHRNAARLHGHGFQCSLPDSRHGR